MSPVALSAAAACVYFLLVIERLEKRETKGGGEKGGERQKKRGRGEGGKRETKRERGEVWEGEMEKGGER